MSLFLFWLGTFVLACILTAVFVWLRLEYDKTIRLTKDEQELDEENSHSNLQ